MVLCNGSIPAGRDSLIATGRGDHSEQAPQVQRLVVQHRRHLWHGNADLGAGLFLDFDELWQHYVGVGQL
jgi:hypothetical protein